MHDPTSLFRFEEHDIYLPILTLEELDNNKKGVTEVARNARQVVALPGRARDCDALTASSKASRSRRKSGGAATGRCTCRPR
jgi:predicted ribonuclease YlaK